MKTERIMTEEFARLVAENVVDLLSDQIYETSESIIDEVKKIARKDNITDLDDLVDFCGVWCEEHGVGRINLIHKLFSYYTGTNI